MAEQSNLDEITTFLNDKFSGETESFKPLTKYFKILFLYTMPMRTTKRLILLDASALRSELLTLLSRG
ncbi:glutamate dehydrogenase [Alteromonas mediterranea 615]|uniref:Glutamate dehydrogenase n=1 Tax=Alteromonas mediterranea 615 TaxID=1300253 RepID=S5AGS1_9ALTE|nr:glutamate dehydrogenase [Alteromonas mediterranea 615]